MSLILSNKLRAVEEGVYMHWCPGCKARHLIHVDKPNSGGARWTYDGNSVSPTFSPSIHITYNVSTVSEEEEERLIQQSLPVPFERKTECHYFLTAGSIHYCSDSAHDLSGQVVPLPDFPGSTLLSAQGD